MTEARRRRRPDLRKELGQHHLRQGELCDPLVGWLRPEGGLVLEIGPGGGVLTRRLLEAGARVWAWEVDTAWAALLRRREPRASVVIGDALEIPWERLPRGTMAAGNLPYNVATALIEALLRRADSVERAGFLMQWEVAQRLVAGPGGRDYGLLSVMTAAFAEPRILGRVAAGSFHPPPKVDGAFVGLVRRRPPFEPERAGAFRETVAAAFSQRRKTLRNALGSVWGRRPAAAMLEAASVEGGRRAETLSLAEFVALDAARAAASSRRDAEKPDFERT